jgi:cation:H+ antiporter
VKAETAAASVVAAKAAPLSALWTFPSILVSAFVIGWAAEAAQFLVSQGLALAILAWLQTLPEFSVEAVIAWQAGKDPAKVHLAIANFTGSIRLLVGLGWPLVYFSAAFFAARTGKRKTWAEIRLEDEHAVQVLCLFPVLAWFTVIWWKGNISLLDAAVLVLMYLGYLWLLSRVPARAEETEDLEDLPRVSRWALSFGPGKRAWAIAFLFVAGGGVLYFAAEAFVESLLAIAVSMGVAPFFFVQWVAPFLSEFPEKLSAFNWARQISKSSMALINLLSSTINQWSVLSGLIPVIYSISRGEPSALVFDAYQREEILLTILQSALGLLLLLNLKLEAYEAGILFVFWLVQFLFPTTRLAMIWVYSGWCGVELLRIATGSRKAVAFAAARHVLRPRRETR